MSSTTTTPGQEPNFYQAKKGLKNWLYTVDHKRIGMMYLVAILAALLLGGVFALLVRIELFSPGQQIVGKDRYTDFVGQNFDGGVEAFEHRVSEDLLTKQWIEVMTFQ